ncbi:MAG: hypothetical protein KC502_08850 [Myxococcales bacterium]|nr:hypothetical protein [Myxococcales bacterium]
MEPYRLKRVYADLRRAAGRGDMATALQALQEAIGTQLPSSTTLTPLSQCTTTLSYRGFKPAELAMLAANIKRIVKFEDVPPSHARAFMARHADRYQMTLGRPYYKDYLLMSSRPDRLPGESQLTTLYASRTGAGRALMELERSEPEAIEDAGDLLDFPSCCSHTFSHIFQRSRQDQDTVNDDAVRALLEQTMISPGDAALDPLSDLDLLAFYPCQPNCNAALSIARTTHTALQRSAPKIAAQASRDLGSPVLFWRMPFFIRFDGDVIPAAQTPGNGPGVGYKSSYLHVFPDPSVSRIQRMFGGCVLPLLALGNLVQVDDGDVVIYADNEEVARLPGEGNYPPLLGLWAGSQVFSDKIDPHAAGTLPTD